MKNALDPEIRARDLRRVVGGRLDLVQWDAGIDPKNEWISASVDSPEYVERFKRWLSSKKISPDCEFVRFDDFSNTLQKFGWREIAENPAPVFVGGRWKMVSHDLGGYSISWEDQFALVRLKKRRSSRQRQRAGSDRNSHGPAPLHPSPNFRFRARSPARVSSLTMGKNMPRDAPA